MEILTYLLWRGLIINARDEQKTQRPPTNRCSSAVCYCFWLNNLLRDLFHLRPTRSSRANLYWWAAQTCSTFGMSIRSADKKYIFWPLPINLQLFTSSGRSPDTCQEKVFLFNLLLKNHWNVSLFTSTSNSLPFIFKNVKLLYTVRASCYLWMDFFY